MVRWSVRSRVLQVREEATGFIRDAVEGIVGAWADVERLPRVKASLLEGIEHHPNLGKHSKDALRQLEA